MGGDVRRMAALRPRAWWARALTAAVAVAAGAFYLLALLYLLLRASSMPPLIPGLPVSPNAPHRYRFAVTALAFALMLSYIALLRWRLHARRASIVIPDQRVASARAHRRAEVAEQGDDRDRALERQVGPRS